jgi:predicted dehydrogenase
MRGAIVGCGYFSQHHLEAWRRIEGVEIVAACDAAIRRARAVSPRPYSDAAAMLDAERPAFIDIATRPETHLELIRLAAERGVAVICQKPLAPSWPESLEAARLCREAGIRAMVHENWRWQPWYRAAARLIEDGALGTVRSYCLRMRHNEGLGPTPFPNQPYFRVMPRFIVYEILLHHLDTARFLFGEIESVSAGLSRTNLAMRGEDRALITVRHESGVTGLIDGHCADERESTGVALGDAWIEGGSAKLAIDNDGHVRLGSQRAWSNDVTLGYRGDSVFAAQSHFVECLRHGREFETGVEDYLKSMAAMEACYLSAERKAAVSPRELLPTKPQSEFGG